IRQRAGKDDRRTTCDRLIDKTVPALLLGHVGGSRLIGNASDVVVAEEFHVTAERYGSDFPSRRPAVVEAEKVGTKTDGEHQDFYATPARNKEMAELVEKYHQRQHEQKRNNPAEHAGAQHVDPRQKIKAHELDTPSRPKLAPDRTF